ncbi:LIM/homeobox protein Awh-like isoform X1 [Vespula pensylvanica]|uniref:LIM/homeobox protein Awh-like isoform X1 n=1 Tax=Vespula pensylvanica TaxID=30213 RepID=UPI001CBA2A44|nr:LIM/homeobox protein Awh-like isoform X1 [Vespula pensylvanica]XP_043678053.1 LIM/homeobox protein Awh-like isoform X1 [Vespula pensylvanica]XP_050860204.1 LIM/homeobox protein Awh isoform X1 [Vespula vulgaris]XP_050860205.1 LIM/homeobox protein Awh isoform X1 [Vespula vulgaris]XP_050860206.1 LIM/homeobox protein Awh isoform X1 [Vespula vulgaris]
MKTEVEDMNGDGVCEGTGTSLGPTESTGGLIGSDMSPGVMECGGCGERVRERTILCVGGRTWHSRCLRCCACARPLHDQHSCFLRGMRLYCRHDYALTFGAKCAKCGRSVGAGDWVRRARERVYHLACFACDACSRQLSTGEQFALLDARLLCKAHYLDVIEGNNTSSDEGGDSESGHKGGNKAKRVRTTFTEEQLSVLQANFQLDSNPDGQDLERIAHVTGLSKRVTQVWFQNSRARQKKHLHTGKMKGQHVHQSPPNSTTSPADFGRHINLHLTYSFQHQQHQHSQQPVQLSPAVCKSPTPSIYHNHGSEQSMDELSQDSMMLSMPNEV